MINFGVKWKYNAYFLLNPPQKNEFCGGFVTFKG